MTHGFCEFKVVITGHTAERVMNKTKKKLIGISFSSEEKQHTLKSNEDD
jgi:hypothetical protein